MYCSGRQSVWFRASRQPSPTWSTQKKPSSGLHTASDSLVHAFFIARPDPRTTVSNSASKKGRKTYNQHPHIARWGHIKTRRLIPHKTLIPTFPSKNTLIVSAAMSWYLNLGLVTILILRYDNCVIMGNLTVYQEALQYCRKVHGINSVRFWYHCFPNSLPTWMFTLQCNPSLFFLAL